MLGTQRDSINVGDQVKQVNFTTCSSILYFKILCDFVYLNSDIQILFIFLKNYFCRGRQCGTRSYSACTDSKRRGQEDGRIQREAKATTEKGWFCICIKMLLFLWQKTPGLFIKLLGSLLTSHSHAFLTYEIIYQGTMWGFNLDGYASVPL